MLQYIKNLFGMKNLILFFPFALLSIKILGNFLLLLILLIGIKKYFVDNYRPLKIKETKMISILSLIYFFVMLASIILNSGFDEDMRHIFRKLHFFLLPLISLAFIDVEIDLKKILKAFKISLICLGLIVSIETILAYFLHTNILGGRVETSIIGESRYTGMINANVFGDLVVVIFFMSIVRIFDENRRELLLTFVSSSLGLWTIFLSGSRGSWVTFTVLMLIFIFFKFKKLSHSVKNQKLFLTGLGIFLIVFGLMFIPKVLTKFEQTSNAVNYWKFNHETYSSAGIRLEMWSSALDAFKDAPWYGYGYRLANSKVSEYASDHAETIAAFTHLHNEYITALLSAGITGLASLLFLLFIPMVYFYKSRHIEENYYFSIMGIILTLGYSVSGLTHMSFGEEHLNAFFVFYIILLIQCLKKDKTVKKLG